MAVQHCSHHPVGAFQQASLHLQTQLRARQSQHNSWTICCSNSSSSSLPQHNNNKPNSPQTWYHWHISKAVWWSCRVLTVVHMGWVCPCTCFNRYRLPRDLAGHVSALGPCCQAVTSGVFCLISSGVGSIAAQCWHRCCAGGIMYHPSRLYHLV